MATVFSIFPIPGTNIAIVIAQDTVTIAANNNTVDDTFTLPKPMRIAAVLPGCTDIPWTAADGVISVGFSAAITPITMITGLTVRVARELAPASARAVNFSVMFVGEFIL